VGQPPGVEPAECVVMRQGAHAWRHAFAYGMPGGMPGLARLRVKTALTKKPACHYAT